MKTATTNRSPSSRAPVQFEKSEAWGVYLRVSDDDQEVETQRVTATEFFVRHDIPIPPSERWYVDVNWSRDETDTRPDWLRMLGDTDAGKLDNLLVTAKDRFGTASGRRKVIFYARLWDAGCRLVLATTDAVLNSPNIASDITALLDGDTEERELREKSNRAVDKMRIHAAAGRWMGGSVPAGLDVVCLDVTGREFWRVQIIGDDLRVKINPDGSRHEYGGKNNFPGRDAGQFLTLRPSLDVGRLQGVRDAFAWVDAEAISNYEVARRLNDRGDVHPSGQPWADHHIETMLGNMAYLGIPTWNRTAQGKWSVWQGGKRIDYEEKNTRQHKQARADWVVPDRQFDPIVDPAIFERVQAKREAARRTGERAPKHPDMWLSGILFCGTCGEKMHGQSADGKPRYVCSSYLKARSQGKKAPRTCPFYYLDHARGEEIVGQFLTDTGQHLPKPNARRVEVSAAMQSAWETVVNRLVEADTAVRERVIEWARTATDAQLAPFVRHKEGFVLKDGRPTYDANGEPVTVPVPYLDGPAVFRQIFAGERDGSQARLDQLEAEERQLSLAHTLNQFPNANVRKHVEHRLADLAIEIGELRKRVTNSADQLADARREWNQLLTDWEAARLALTSNISGRQKADDVRKVIARIDLTFGTTGRKKPKYYVAAASIVPVGAAGEPHELVSIPYSAGRCGTSSGEGTRGSACGTPASRST